MKSLLVFPLVIAFSMGAMAAKPPKFNEKAMKSALEDRLKDADSAKFKDITYSETKDAHIWNMCGSINAKNGYGAYAGFGRFYGLVAVIEKGKPNYSVISIDDTIANQMCAHHGL